MTCEVTGEGTVEISYLARSESGSATVVKDAALPLKKTVQVPLDKDPTVAIVLGDRGGQASCTLAVRGAHVQRATASGTYGRATCSGPPVCCADRAWSWSRPRLSRPTRSLRPRSAPLVGTRLPSTSDAWATSAAITDSRPPSAPPERTLHPRACHPPPLGHHGPKRGPVVLCPRRGGSCRPRLPPSSPLRPHRPRCRGGLLRTGLTRLRDGPDRDHSPGRQHLASPQRPAGSRRP